jgi:hypothetical protein
MEKAACRMIVSSALERVSRPSFIYSTRCRTILLQEQRPASTTIHKRDIVIPPQENPFLNIWNKTTNENKQYDKMTQET